MSDRATTTAAEFVRQFAHFSDLALSHPVIVTRNGRPRSVLLSFAEYERLRRRDRQVFTAADTPEQFLASIEERAKPGMIDPNANNPLDADAANSR
jgi:PHD/YefM family antitoxin component YafN of YafNO toxin-antitoxin module